MLILGVAAVGWFLAGEPTNLIELRKGIDSFVHGRKTTSEHHHGGEEMGPPGGPFYPDIPPGPFGPGPYGSPFNPAMNPAAMGGMGPTSKNDPNLQQDSMNQQMQQFQNQMQNQQFQSQVQNQLQQMQQQQQMQQMMASGAGGGAGGGGGGGGLDSGMNAMNQMMPQSNTGVPAGMPGSPTTAAEAALQQQLAQTQGLQPAQLQQLQQQQALIQQQQAQQAQFNGQQPGIFPGQQLGGMTDPSMMAMQQQYGGMMQQPGMNQFGMSPGMTGMPMGMNQFGGMPGGMGIGSPGMMNPYMTSPGQSLALPGGPPPWATGGPPAWAVPSPIFPHHDMGHHFGWTRGRFNPHHFEGHRFGGEHHRDFGRNRGWRGGFRAHLATAISSHDKGSSTIEKEEYTPYIKSHKHHKMCLPYFKNVYDLHNIDIGGIYPGLDGIKLADLFAISDMNEIFPHGIDHCDPKKFEIDINNHCNKLIRNMAGRTPEHKVNALREILIARSPYNHQLNATFPSSSPRPYSPDISHVLPLDSTYEHNMMSKLPSQVDTDMPPIDGPTMRSNAGFILPAKYAALQMKGTNSMPPMIDRRKIKNQNDSIYFKLGNHRG